MAAMDIRKARALAEQMIKSGQNKGLDLEDLVQQIVAESAGAGAPQTATGAGLMIVPPRTVTPATPAPMQPGVQLVAPKPTAPAQPQGEEMPAQGVAPRPASRPSRYQPELDRVLANLGAAKKAMSDAVASGKKPNVVDQIRLDTMQETADRLGALVRAEGGPDAEIPEEMRAAFEGRQARIARREELLAEQKARSPWEALLAGGAALTQGRQGESFGEALTRGLQTGLQEFGRARRAGEEGAESIAEARDQALMDRYNMREQAVANARQRALEMMGIGDTSRDRAIANLRLPTQIGAEETAAELAKLNLKNAPEMAKLDRLVALARINASNREGRGDGRVDVEGRADRAETGKAAARYRGYAARYEALRAANPGATMQALREADPKTVDDYLAARAELEGYSAELERTQGFTPYIGGRNLSVGALTGGRKPPVPGATLAPDGKYYVPDPKRPGKYKQVVY
jgi:hypothetical protein